SSLSRAPATHRAVARNNQTRRREIHFFERYCLFEIMNSFLQPLLPESQHGRAFVHLVGLRVETKRSLNFFRGFFVTLLLRQNPCLHRVRFRQLGVKRESALGCRETSVAISRNGRTQEHLRQRHQGPCVG